MGRGGAGAAVPTPRPLASGLGHSTTRPGAPTGVQEHPPARAVGPHLPLVCPPLEEPRHRAESAVEGKASELSAANRPGARPTPHQLTGCQARALLPRPLHSGLGFLLPHSPEDEPCEALTRVCSWKTPSSSQDSQVTGHHGPQEWAERGRSAGLTYVPCSRGSKGGCCAPYTCWMLFGRKGKPVSFSLASSSTHH